MVLRWFAGDVPLELQIYSQRVSFTLVSSVISHLLHLFRVLFHIFSTRFECSFTSYPLASSAVSHLLDSFRVQFHIFSTRFECSFTSSPLVSSVILAKTRQHNEFPVTHVSCIRSGPHFAAVAVGTKNTLVPSVILYLPHPFRV